MEELYWHKITEHNDHEGETWHFFVQLTDQEAAHISYTLSDDSSYVLSDKLYDEPTIDVLVSEADEGYMPKYNKCYAPYPSDILEMSEEDMEEEFYKGQFWNGR